MEAGSLELEEQLRGMALALQKARAELQAHQALHSAMSELECFQADLLRAGNLAKLVSELGSGAGHEQLATERGPGLFSGVISTVVSVATRLKENVALALVRGGFYSPTDDDLRRAGRAGRPASPRLLKPPTDHHLHTAHCRSFAISADVPEILRRNAAQRELLHELVLKARELHPSRSWNPPAPPHSNCRSRTGTTLPAFSAVGKVFRRGRGPGDRGADAELHRTSGKA